MSTEQQRKMLEAAARACGMWESRLPVASVADGEFYEYVKRTYWENGRERHEYWNPLYNALDTAEMCAKLGIGNHWYLFDALVVCGPSYNNVTAYFKDHDNSRLKAWMYAATMVATKIGDLK